jgi:hypothetical protein
LQAIPVRSENPGNKLTGPVSTGRHEVISIKNDQALIFKNIISKINPVIKVTP